MHVGVCVLSFCIYVCVWVWEDTLSQKSVKQSVSSTSVLPLSERPFPWCLSVCVCAHMCVCSCVHFYDLKQILLAIIFLCGKLVWAPWRHSELGPGADRRPAATWLSWAGGGLVVQLFPQAEAVLSDHPVSHKPLTNMLTQPHPPTLDTMIAQKSP